MEEEARKQEYLIAMANYHKKATDIYEKLCTPGKDRTRPDLLVVLNAYRDYNNYRRTNTEYFGEEQKRESDALGKMVDALYYEIKEVGNDSE